VKKDQDKYNPRLTKKLVIIIVTVLLLVAAGIGLFFAIQPQRTVENFCRSAKEEKSNFKANTSYDKLLGSFRKLDAVAPEDIRSDTSLIVKGYDSIVSDPSKAVTSELGISSSQMRVNDYITKNCPNY
jgi:capsular polysaccharide biosynthesis protein